MGQSRKSVRTNVSDDRASVSERVVGLLRNLYPSDWSKNVARDLEASVHTVRKLDERGSAPSLALFKRMVREYGPEALAVLFDDEDSPEWLSDTVRAWRLAKLEHEMAAIQGRIENLRRDA